MTHRSALSEGTSVNTAIETQENRGRPAREPLFKPVIERLFSEILLQIYADDGPAFDNLCFGRFSQVVLESVLNGEGPFNPKDGSEHASEEDHHVQ